MKAGPSDPRPLGLLGAFLLATGLSLRLLVPDAPIVAPVVAMIPSVLLLLGGAVLVLEQALRKGSCPNLLVLALPLLLLPGTFPLTHDSVRRATDLLAAIAAGAGVAALVKNDGARPVLVRGLLATGALVALLAIAEAAYQRDEVRRFVHESGHRIAESEVGRAFLASDRPAATLTNPNVLAGVLALLMPLAATLRNDRGRLSFFASALLCVLGFSFVLTWSAGATLSLLLAFATLPLFVRTLSPRFRWVAHVSCGLAIAGIALLLLGLQTDLLPQVLAAKVVTFNERLSYHALLPRILGEFGFLGLGFGGTREAMSGAVRPGEPFSAHLHDSWAQLTLEGGPIVLLALIPLILFLRAQIRASAPSSSKAGVEPRGIHGALRIGFVVGMAAAPLFVRSVTLFPLSLEKPWLDALTAAAIAAPFLGLRTGGRTEAAVCNDVFRALTLAGILAFLWHGFLDFDFEISGAVTALAAIFGLLSVTKTAGSARERAGALLFAVLVFAILPWLGSEALNRDATHVHLARGAQAVNDKAALPVLVHAAPKDVEALLRVLPPLAENVPERARTLLSDARRRLGPIPSLRLAAVRSHAREAVMNPKGAPELASRAEKELRSGERNEAEMAYRIHLIHLVANQPAMAETFRERSLKAAKQWNLDPIANDWLKDLGGH